MTLSLSNLAVPTFERSLVALSAILSKAEAHAAAKKIDPSVFLTARLAPDMFPLTRQVQIAADFAKGGTARLAGVEVPSYPDTETTFEALRARIDTTLAFVRSCSRTAIDAAGDKDVMLKMRGQEMTFKGAHYLVHLVLPNFYFHLTAAYAILRHNGVDVGKQDFIGQV